MEIEVDNGSIGEIGETQAEASTAALLVAWVAAVGFESASSSELDDSSLFKQKNLVY